MKHLLAIVAVCLAASACSTALAQDDDTATTSTTTPADTTPAETPPTLEERVVDLEIGLDELTDRANHRRNGLPGIVGNRLSMYLLNDKVNKLADELDALEARIEALEHSGHCTVTDSTPQGHSLRRSIVSGRTWFHGFGEWIDCHDGPLTWHFTDLQAERPCIGDWLDPTFAATLEGGTTWAATLPAKGITDSCVTAHGSLGQLYRNTHFYDTDGVHDSEGNELIAPGWRNYYTDSRYGDGRPTGYAS